MRFRRATTSATPRPPAILYGAAALALLSLAWSTHEITALVDEGRYGLSIAVAGDIGWLAVLRAEYRRTRLLGQQWIAPAAGWTIAVSVAALLVTQGVIEGSVAKAVAGPITVLVAKTVWAFTLAEMRDPAALTADQEAEIASVMRDSEFEARLHAAQLDQLGRAADAEIARIRGQARITLARDEVDFEIRLERIAKGREIEHRSPIAITASSSEQPPEQIAIPPIPLATPTPSAQPAAVLTSAIADREQPSIADLARDQVAIIPDNPTAVRAVLAIRPDAHEPSVAAAVRKARSKMSGGYN